MESLSGNDAIGQLLSGAGIPAQVMAQAGDPRLEEDILSELEAVSKELPQGDVGGTRVVIGGRFFSLGEAGWNLLWSLAALAVSTLDPTGLTKLVVLAKVLELLKGLQPLLKKLDPGSLLVCSAIAAVSAGKKQRPLAERNASRQDIIDYFTQRGESTPVKLDEILSKLKSDGVLTPSYYRDSGPYYEIKF